MDKSHSVVSATLYLGYLAISKCVNKTWGRCTILINVLESFQTVLTNPKLVMSVTTHHVEMARVCKDSSMLPSTGYLLYEYVEATCLGHFETLNALVTFLQLLVIQTELPLCVITPYENFSEVESDTTTSIVVTRLSGTGSLWPFRRFLKALHRHGGCHQAIVIIHGRVLHLAVSYHLLATFP